jgi:hypothetical protein
MKPTSHLLIALVSGLALAVAATASAKSLSSARLCGPDDCAPLNDTQSVMTILGGGGSQPPPTDRYYRFDVTFDKRVTHSYLYVPSAGLVAAEGPVADVVWYPAGVRARDVLARAARNLDPFAAPAQWPASFADPIFTPSTPATADESRDWAPWTIGALVAIAGAAAFGRRVVSLRLSQGT